MVKAAPLFCLVGLIAMTMGLPRAAGAANRIEALDAEITSLVDRMSESIVSIAAVSQGPDLPGGAARLSRSIGTGVVIEDGVVLTTASVVGYASRVEVGTAGGGKYTGEVVGTDPATDLAVVRVDGLKARPAPLSKKRNVPPGSLVFVIGNSYGRLPSVSMGVISNAPSPLGEDGGEDMLRMSLPVNPGNTGSPIVNASGEVIGLLVGRLSMQPISYTMRIRDGGVQDFAQVIQPANMSVGIPAYRLRSMAREIMEQGGKRPGFLGVRVVETSFPEGATGEWASDIGGVMVTSVVEGSPAESIGLEAGDIILKFGSDSLLTASALREMVSSAPPGSTLTISFRRGRDVFDREVRMTNRSPEQLRRATYSVRPEDIDLRINMIQEEIERLQKELDRLEAGR